MALRIGDQRLTIEDVDVLIPHQANDRISLMVAKGLKIPVEKVVRNIDRIGNTTAASIPIALDEAVKAGRIGRGSLVSPRTAGSSAAAAAMPSSTGCMHRRAMMPAITMLRVMTEPPETLNEKRDGSMRRPFAFAPLVL